MNEDKRIPTNLRTLLILEILGKSDRPMTPTEINTHLDLPKQTVHRLCNKLEEEGFLKREPHGKRLQPSNRLKELASGILYNARDKLGIRQVLVDISSQVRETVNFAVPQDGGMMYLDRVETDWPLRIQLPVGSNVPFHSTASGKCFLASLSPAQRKRIVKTMTLEAITPNTYCDVDHFLDELQTVSKQGYAVDNEEFMEGMIAIAVPVKDTHNRFCAAIAFHAPMQRMNLSQAIERKDIMLEGANKLGQYFTG